MVRNNSHNWDLMADDAHREARGLISASLTSRGGKRFAVPIAWRIQGNKGGEDIADKLRGPLNNGGLYGEREGWYLPAAGRPARAAAGPGPGSATRRRRRAPTGCAPASGWTCRRTTTSSSAWPSAMRRQSLGTREPRAHLRQRLEHGAVHRPHRAAAHFVIPPGILDPNGENTIALAVTTDGKAKNALEPVKLVTLRAVRGGVRWRRWR
jgi:hypothetical protein